MMNGFKVVAYGAIVVAMSWSLGVVNASPSDAVGKLPIARANPKVPLSVVRSLPRVIQMRSDLHIDPSIKADTPLIYTDGSVVPGQRGLKAQAAKACGRRMVAPVGFPWTRALKSNCGMIGMNDRSYVSYVKWTDSNSRGTAQFRALGFKKIRVCEAFVYRNPKCRVTYKVKWYGAGSGNGVARIYWGNNASTPAMKVRAVGTIGWAGGFWH